MSRQLKHNIQQLDLRIGEISKQIREHEKTNGYENVLSTLTDLIKLRSQLAKAYDDSSEVVEELDRQIEELTVSVTTIERSGDYESKVKHLEELSKVRCQLAESLAKQSNAPAIISGLFGVSAVLLVLHYEKTEIVTSKAFGLATSLFRGK